MKNNKAKIVLSQSELNKKLDDAKLEGIQQTTLLFLSYVMEDPAIDCDEDKIIEMLEGVTRYLKAVDEHLISMNQVSDIIHEKTGMRIKWRR